MIVTQYTHFDLIGIKLGQYLKMRLQTTLYINSVALIDIVE